MVDIFHSIDALLFISLVITINFDAANIYHNIAWSVSTLAFICILSYFLERNVSSRKNTHFYWIHNLSFPFLLFSIANRENNFGSVSNYSVILFSICISISSMGIYKTKSTYYFKRWQAFFFKLTLITLFFLCVAISKCEYKIANVGFLAIIYYQSLLPFLLNSVCGSDGYFTQFGELNIFSQMISFLLFVSLSNVGLNDSGVIFDWKQCINYITIVVILLIPVNMFTFEMLLSKNEIISKNGYQSRIFNSLSIIVAMSTLYLSLYPTAKYIYGVATFIIKMIIESEPIRKLIIYWVIVTICLPIMLNIVDKLNIDSKTRKIFTRKVFHLFLITLFFPQIISLNATPSSEYKSTIEFTVISIYLVSCIFVYLEMIRKCQNRKLTMIINGLLVPFLDGKDNVNSLIITHICLLVGISIPIFKEFLLIKDIKEFDVVSATLGIATIGVGDAFSAIFGILFGRVCLPGNRNKTLIGMIAFFVSTCSCLQFTCFFSSNQYSLPKLYLISFFSSLLEAYSHYIDNATIPMYSLTLYTNIR